MNKTVEWLLMFAVIFVTVWVFYEIVDDINNIFEPCVDQNWTGTMNVTYPDGTIKDVNCSEIKFMSENTLNALFEKRRR